MQVAAKCGHCVSGEWSVLTQQAHRRRKLPRLGGQALRSRDRWGHDSAILTILCVHLPSRLTKEHRICPISQSSGPASPVSPQPIPSLHADTKSTYLIAIVTLRWKPLSPMAANLVHPMPKFGPVGALSLRASSGCSILMRPCWSTQSQAGTNCHGWQSSWATSQTMKPIQSPPPKWQSRRVSICCALLAKLGLSSTWKNVVSSTFTNPKANLITLAASTKC